MKSAVAEITKITQSLPPHQAAQLLDFARSLKQRPVTKAKATSPGNVADGDSEWERIINDPRPRPKLAAKLKQIEKLIAEGRAEPLDFDRL